MTKGLLFTSEDVQEKGNNVKFFTGKRAIVYGKDLLFYIKLYTDGKAQQSIYRRESLDTMYGQIRTVYDENGICIAERINKNARLLSTGKGKGKQIQHPTSIGVYEQLRNLNLV